MAETSKCKSCGASIIFAKTESGKTMPLDAEPVEGGTYFLGDDGVAYYRTSVERSPGLRKSHFATCDAAAKFRKPK